MWQDIGTRSNLIQISALVNLFWRDLVEIPFLMQFPKKVWRKMYGLTGFDFEELNSVVGSSCSTFLEINFVNNPWFNS